MKFWKHKDTDLNFSDAILKQIGNKDKDLDFSDVNLTKAGFANVNLTDAKIDQDFVDAVESLSNESANLEM